MLPVLEAPSTSFQQPVFVIFALFRGNSAFKITQEFSRLCALGDLCG
jgi:hypothetical protein